MKFINLDIQMFGGRGASSSSGSKARIGNLGDGLTTDFPFYQVGENRFFAGDIFVTQFNEGGDTKDWNQYLVTGVNKNGIEVELQNTGSMYRKNQIGEFTNMDSSSRALKKAKITEQGGISRRAYATARVNEKRRLIKILDDNKIKYQKGITDIAQLRSIVNQNKKAGLIK